MASRVATTLRGLRAIRSAVAGQHATSSRRVANGRTRAIGRRQTFDAVARSRVAVGTATATLCARYAFEFEPGPSLRELPSAVDPRGRTAMVDGGRRVERRARVRLRGQELELAAVARQCR